MVWRVLKLGWVGRESIFKRCVDAGRGNQISRGQNIRKYTASWPAVRSRLTLKGGQREETKAALGRQLEEAQSPNSILRVLGARRQKSLEEQGCPGRCLGVRSLICNSRRWQCLQGLLIWTKTQALGFCTFWATQSCKVHGQRTGGAVQSWLEELETAVKSP